MRTLLLTAAAILALGVGTAIASNGEAAAMDNIQLVPTSSDAAHSQAADAQSTIPAGSYHFAVVLQPGTRGSVVEV